MKIMTTYKVKIKHHNHIFKQTVAIYRNAVDYLIDVCLKEWEDIETVESSKERVNYVEKLIHQTKDNPNPKYDFDSKFYKFPSYLRRAVIQEAIGKISSYRSNLKNWNENPVGKQPSIPKAGFIYPTLYRDNMYNQLDTYQAEVKVFVRNTWDWVTIDLRKSDIDYINKRCSNRKKCAPTLQKRGKEWFLDFPFEESVKLSDTDIFNQAIVAVDLGINNPATVTVMKSDGTILGRHFCRLTKEQDSLNHAINRIKKAQQHGTKHMPRLWARAKGINHDISVKTAQFVADIAAYYNADSIVFEHLDKKGKIRGDKKQRLHLWRCKEVQAIVTDKVHRMGMRVSHICAWNTSKLAFDGSGFVERNIGGNYSICRFTTDKIYNCDLSASYNIGARYFIREILKSLTERKRLDIEAKVPQCSKRSTSTLSTLISLNAVLASV